MKQVNVFYKALANVAYLTAKDNIKSICYCFFYQPKVDKKIIAQLKKNEH